VFAILFVVAGLCQTPTFQAGTRVVEINIAATHSGQPVTDLRAEDLRVFDNGKEQTIASFERIGNAAASGGTKAPQLAVILLDAQNTSFSDQVYGREGVTKMLARLPLGQRIALFAFGDKLHLLHKISTDYDSLREAVEEYGGEQPMNWKPEINKEAVRRYSEMDAFDERRRILATLDALTDLTDWAKNVPGQKKLVWVSAAFPVRFASEDYHQDVERVMQKLVAANTTLFPVSPQGLKTIHAESMMELAELTGGTVFKDSNDTAALVRGAMDEWSDGYLLTFVPTDNQQNGEFHDVRLKTTRRGVELRYRLGYAAK